MSIPRLPTNSTALPHSGTFLSFTRGGHDPPLYQVSFTGGFSPRVGYSCRLMVQWAALSGCTGPTDSTVVGYFKSSAQKAKSQ